MRSLRSLLVVLPLVVMVACGGDAPDPDPGEDAATAGDPAVAMDDTATMAGAPSAGTAEDASFTLQPADLDAYVAGLTAESEQLEGIPERMASAKTGNDSLEIVAEATPVSLDETGARAAGMSVDRFRQVVDAVNGVLGRLEMGEMQRKMEADVDTTGMAEEMKARIRENREAMKNAYGDPYAGLSPETADALRARADELARVRAKFMGQLVKMGS